MPSPGKGEDLHHAGASRLLPASQDERAEQRELGRSASGGGVAGANSTYAEPSPRMGDPGPEHRGDCTTASGFDPEPQTDPLAQAAPSRERRTEYRSGGQERVGESDRRGHPRKSKVQSPAPRRFGGKTSRGLALRALSRSRDRPLDARDTGRSQIPRHGPSPWCATGAPIIGRVATRPRGPGFARYSGRETRFRSPAARFRPSRPRRTRQPKSRALDKSPCLAKLIIRLPPTTQKTL